VYNDKSYSLIGERSRKVYRIGDVVNVMLIKADVAARRIEFTIVDKNNGENDEKALESDGKENGKPKRKRRRKTPDEAVLLHVQGKKKKKKTKKAKV